MHTPTAPLRLVWKTDTPPPSFSKDLSERLPQPLEPVSPYIRRPLGIYNVSFDDYITAIGNPPLRSIVEMLLWEYCPPLEPEDQKIFERHQQQIDHAILGWTQGRFGCDPFGDLIEVYRGWHVWEGENSRLLFSLFLWGSQEAEHRFKDPQKCSKGSLVTLPPNTYETSFASRVKCMEERGWLRPKEQIHIELRKWRGV